MKDILKFFILFFLFVNFLFASESALTKEEKEWLQNNPKAIQIVSKELKNNSNSLTPNSLNTEEVAYLKNKKIIKMCVLPNWLPFEQIDENQKHKGIGADLIKIISKYINTPIELLPTKEWGVSLQNIRDRKCDILPVAMDIPSRRDAMNFTKPYTAEPFVIATKHDEFFIKDSKDIGNRKVGIVSNYAFIEVLKINNPQIQIINVKNAYDGLKKVQNGELFGYIDIMAAVGYTIQKHSMLDLKIAGKLEFDIKLSIASRNDEPLLNSIMQKALNEISKDEIRTIVGKWISIKVEQSFDYTKLFYVIGFFSIILILVIYKNRSIHSINNQLSLANKEIYKQQQKAESLLQYQESLLALFDRGDAVLLKWKNDENWNLEYVSKSIKKLTGHESHEFTSKEILYSSCIKKDDFSNVIESIKECINKKLDYYRHEPYRILTKDQEEKWILQYTVTLKNNDKITHFLGYITDITEHIKHQEIISHQSKMASLGEMIGNISHQWRQPLSLISTVATGSKLQKEIGVLSDEQFFENMNVINKNAQYLSSTIDDFKNFIKGDREVIKFNICEKIDSFLNVVKASISNHNINIINNCDNQIEIESYPNEMIQSFINIFNNAKDALKEMPENERYFFISTKKLRNSIEITFKDNAGGISESIIDKIFEPYTTTKHKSQGTGLGLNITYNFIVVGMNGKINVSNISFKYNGKTYQGAQFTITLPLTNN